MRRLLFSFSLLAFFISLFATGKKNDSLIPDEIQRKADYIFLESQKHYYVDEVGDYFNLLNIAKTLDNKDQYYGKELGYLLVLLADRESEVDSTVFKEGMAMLREAYLKDPDDFYSAVRYAAICQHFGYIDESLDIWENLTDKNPGKPEVAFSYADILFQRGDTADLHKTLEIYKNLERSQGYSLGLSSQKIRSYLTLRDTTNVLHELDSLLSRSPRNVQNQIYSGDVFMVMKMPDSALYHYNRAIEIDSTSGLAYHKLAEYYQTQGDSVKYDTEVFNALSQPDLDINEKVELMRGYVQNLYTDSLQRPRIEKLFELLTEQHPHEAEIRDLYSTYLAVTGDYYKSAEQTALCLDLDPSVITNWNRLISLYFTLQNNADALSTSLEAIHYFPDNAMFKLMASSAYIALEQPDSAISLLEIALKQTPAKELETLSDIETSLGDAFYKMKLPDSAFVHYDNALTYNPRNLLAMNNAAYFLACEGKDLARAENLSYVTIRDYPDNGTYLDTYAWVMFKQKNYEEAKNYIDKTLEIESEPTSELLEHAGDIYFMNLLPVEALEYWNRALELDPGNTLLQKKVKEKRYLIE